MLDQAEQHAKQRAYVDSIRNRPKRAYGEMRLREIRNGLYTPNSRRRTLASLNVSAMAAQAVDLQLARIRDGKD